MMLPVEIECYGKYCEDHENPVGQCRFIGTRFIDSDECLLFNEELRPGREPPMKHSALVRCQRCLDEQERADGFGTYGWGR